MAGSQHIGTVLCDGQKFQPLLCCHAGIFRLTELGAMLLAGQHMQLAQAVGIEQHFFQQGFKFALFYFFIVSGIFSSLGSDILSNHFFITNKGVSC